MSHSKQELIPNDPNTIFNLLDKDIVEYLENNLSINALLSLANSSITTYNLFKPHLHQRFALQARLCVVQGNVERLLLIAKHGPDFIFVKGQVTDPRQRMFYNASAYQLINFLCDHNMKNQLLSSITGARFTAIQKQQLADLGRGGADLIKLDFNPLVVLGTDFKGITEFKRTYTLINNSECEVTIPLLENRDGIIYYLDDNKIVHFYYVNRETRELRELKPLFTTEEEKQLFEKLKACLDSMENNSSRRSSNIEHQLIEKLLKCTLHRQGIEYEHRGVRYRDSHSSFNLLNAYRKSMRLYEEAKLKPSFDEANNYWCKGVGKAQGEEMWLLQRICEKNRPFYKFPKNINTFNRALELFNWASGEYEPIFSNGKIVDGLGSMFTLSKGSASCARPLTQLLNGYVVLLDFIVVAQLVENAKAKIIELERDEEPELANKMQP